MTEIRTKGAFSPNELLPRTGYPQPKTTAETLAEAGRREQILRSIYVQNANHLPVFKGLDLVLSLGVKGVFQTGVRCAAPSYAGKSASADQFAKLVAGRGTFPNSMPVVRVELEQACTSKRFWSSILMKYGDGFTAAKDETALRRSTYDAFEQFGTKLLIIDEVQHAGFRSSGSSAPTDVIKRFIQDAQVGVGLFGNEDALSLLQSNNQLSHRLQDPCDIEPLRLTDAKDRKVFTRFVRNYDDALVTTGLFAKLAGLDDPRIVDCLMAISSGYLGRVVTLLQLAARRAHLREAETIEICDLSQACSSWAVKQRLAPHDPFRFGL